MRSRIGSVALLSMLLVVGVGVIPASAANDVKTLSWMPPSGQTGTVAGSWAKLERPVSGASFTLHTKSLQKGHAYTIWWVIFDNPQACTTSSGPVRCGGPDVGNPAVRASLQQAAGHVVGASGAATFGGRIAYGDTSGCQPGLPCNGGLTNPNAEIHLVVRTHGEAVPGYVPEQIGSFDGGCHPGQPNVGQCKNLQGVGFPA